MPHYKCMPCRIRVDMTAGPANPMGERCPDCDSTLEPVAALSEIVGFARRGWLDYRSRLDDERWDDDAGSRLAEAVALPVPRATWSDPIQ